MAVPRAFSLQDASLLSGIEPLPLSSPPSPRLSPAHLSSPPSPRLSPAHLSSPPSPRLSPAHLSSPPSPRLSPAHLSSPPSPRLSPAHLSSPPPLLPSASLRRAVSSQVTAQLYASLRRSQEEEPEEIRRASGRRELDRGWTMASEVEDLADELSRRLQEGVETSERKEPSPYISQMESLRCHLKNMLTLGSSVTSHGEAPEKCLEQQSDATSTLLSTRPGQDLSPTLSLAGLEGLFPRYSTLYNAPPPDLQLRDALEKETTRRKHLERHIQNLQNEMLELQQRVSVMLAADRRKDSMIQQLDQTLALVVGGWKQQEQQREESMRRLRQEKEEAEQAQSRDQETLTQVEQQLAEALESMEREKNATKEEQIELQRLADERKARLSQIQAEWEAAEEVREKERRELESLQRRMQEQQRSREEREQELQEECRRVQDAGARELKKEKALSQQETQKSQQLQLALTALQGDVLRLERELQASHRETDTLQMELNLEKARNESEKVRIESEHKMRLEEVITERLSALHDESAQHLCTVREQHRKRLLELTSQHEAELCRQMAQFKSEFQERERRHREIVMDCERKLSHSEERCLELSRALRRLESERAEMLSQLQDVMKSHWSQALRVLSAKVPSESSMIAASHQQTETSEQWTSQITREGVYGEETSVRARQGIVGADNLTGVTSHHLKESSGSRKETAGHVQRSSLQTVASGSQHLEDNQGGRQVGSRRLTDSSGSDLINFSRIMDERSQSNTESSSITETSLRFTGDGAHMSSKAVMVGQAIPNGAQLSGKIGQAVKAPGTADITSLYNSGDLRTLQEMIARDTVRKYIAGQWEPYGQLMADKSQTFFYPEMPDFNIIGTDTSGHSVTRHKTLMPRDSSGHQIDGTHQSMMGSSQQAPFSEKNIFSHTGNSQFKSAGGYSSTGGHNQAPNLRNGTTIQIHNYAKEDGSWTTDGGRLKEYSHSVTQPSLDRAPLTIPNLSPIAKASFQGHSREFTNPSAYQENPASGHHPSHGVPDSEESFYPMQVEELSHSFSSHHGFFPLEPHPDGTMTGTMSASLPQTSPERPFHEKPSTNFRETLSNWGKGDQATPNPVLQYYIRMLLDRTPGDPLNELDKGLFQVNPDMTEFSQSLQSRGNQPLPRSEEKEQDVSRLPTNPKKNAQAPEAVKKEVLSSQRRPGPPKPLKRVSVQGGRAGIWK